MPKHDSLAERLKAFFRDNPEEELTWSDASQKFGYSLDVVRATVYRLQAKGEIETVRVIRAKA